MELEPEEGHKEELEEVTAAAHPPELRNPPCPND